jgi:glycosyltransferase involved in cell wall biosynthesis
MRFGIDFLSLYASEIGGGETFLRGIANSLPALKRHEFVYFVSEFAQLDGRLDDSVVLYEVTLGSRHRFRRVLAEQALLPLAGRRARLDAMLMPGNQPLLLSHVPQVVVIQDLSPLFYARTFPDHVSRSRTRLLTGLLRVAARRAAQIIVPSKFSRDEVIYHLKAPSSAIRVVPYAVPSVLGDRSSEFVAQVRASFGLSGPFVLCVAFKQKHKNLDGLVNAWTGLAQRNRFRLVLVGRPANGYEDLVAAIRAHSLEQSVLLVDDFLSDAQLAALYQAAHAFVMPSLYEGFGFPVLEALRHGVPTACSNAASLPEVAGDGALLFDPWDAASMTDALSRVLDDETLRQQLARAGRRRATEFGWDATSKGFTDALEAAASRSGSR